MSLFILSQSTTKSSSNLGQCFSVLPLGACIATLVEFYGHVNLHIDELFFLDTQDIYGLPGRMSLYSAIAFSVIGIALFIQPYAKLWWLVRVTALAVTFIGALSALSYIWN